ncbi:MAG: hypothetical protein IPP82_06380 [Xanthomonadales bacterium]|nr:hypothetical protein [Xanthomonadales bacterium]
MLPPRRIDLLGIAQHVVQRGNDGQSGPFNEADQTWAMSISDKLVRRSDWPPPWRPKAEGD